MLLVLLLLIFVPTQTKAYTDQVSNVRFDVDPRGTQIIVDMWHFRLHLIEGGYLTGTYPVATGMPGTPTPVARWMVGIKSVRPFTAPMSARHMRLFRFTGGGYAHTGFAIHGTPWPWSIGSQASHGCVRMYNWDIIDLYPRVPVGTSVQTLNLSSQYDLRLWGNYDGRLWGKSAIATAVAVAQEGWQRTKVVLLARTDHYSDALAASTLAQAYKNDPRVGGPAPLLLTQSHSLSSETLEEMNRLGAEIAIVLGGPGAISETVLNQLRANGITPDRVWQDGAYGTAADVARRLRINALSWGASPPDTAVLTTGEDFADALAVASPAAANNMPILLTKKDFLSPETSQVLQELQIQRVIVIGGPSAISEAVLETLREMGIEVATRIWGNDAYETAIKIGSEGNAYFHFSDGYPVFVVRGDFFSDGLTISALAARFRAPVLLTEPSRMPPSTQSFLTVFKNRIRKVYILGGPGAISAAVESQAKRAIR